MSLQQMPFATPQQPQSLEAVLQHVVFEPQSNPPPQLIVGEDVGGCVGGSERNNNTAAEQWKKEFHAFTTVPKHLVMLFTKDSKPAKVIK